MLAALAAVAVIGIIVHYIAWRDPLADLKKTSVTTLESDAEKVLGSVMEAMEKADLKYLGDMVENRNAMAFETRYKDAMFAKGGLGKMERVGVVKKMDRVSHQNWIVRVKSKTDGREYYVTLIRNEKKEIRIGGISYADGLNI